MTSISFTEGVKPGVRQDLVAQDWSRRGYGCDIWVDPPDQVWADCVHERDELLMPITGRLQVDIGEHRYRLEAGQELHIPAHQPHSVRNLSHTTVCWLYGYRR